MVALPFVSFEFGFDRGLESSAGHREKRLDKKWHPMENALRAVSAFPLR